MFKRFLVFVLLIVSSIAVADVAMITDLSGKVTATLEEARWEASLAEILPDGTHLKTAKDSSLTLIHMLENKEYRIEAESEAVITAAGVTGEKLTGKELTVVASSFDLGADSASQAGAAHVDRGVSSDKFDIDEPMVEPAMLEISAPAPKSAPRAVEKMKKADSYGQREEQINPAKSSDSESFQAVVVSHDKKISFALPEALVNKFTDESGILDIDNSEVKRFSGFGLTGGWMSVDVEVRTSESEMVLNLKGDQDIMSVKVFSGSNISGEISLAWKLEREQYLAQAAWIWLNLRDQGRLSAEKAEVHLLRIREKMLK